MCGEYQAIPNWQAPQQGSPPHVWRIHDKARSFIPVLGITSTCVENTVDTGYLSHSLQDHLHMCGEYIQTVSPPMHLIGSPPHTWRIRSRLFIGYSFNRITSTYVENTATLFFMEKYSEDHLHIRGEYRQSSAKSNYYLGSPPHTWRIPPGHVVMISEFRITSTYVENTLFKICISASKQDHLHIRGEYLVPTDWFPACNRITSTYVENTRCCLSSRQFSQDHLHIRGEYYMRLPRDRSRMGSPPHTWRIPNRMT